MSDAVRKALEAARKVVADLEARQADHKKHIAAIMAQSRGEYCGPWLGDLSGEIAGARMVAAAVERAAAER